MNAMMRHRGPDDDGRHLDPCGVALGARRLSIIDVAGGHQPLTNEDDTVWAVLNGEIYNHPALRRAAAGGPDTTLRSRSDTEVLVHLYEDYGDALVHALEGMYAFAIWDARARPPSAHRPRPLRREAAVLPLRRRSADLRLGADRAAARHSGRARRRRRDVAGRVSRRSGTCPAPRSMVQRRQPACRRAAC